MKVKIEWRERYCVLSCQYNVSRGLNRTDRYCQCLLFPLLSILVYCDTVNHGGHVKWCVDMTVRHSLRHTNVQQSQNSPLPGKYHNSITDGSHIRQIITIINYLLIIHKVTNKMTAFINKHL